MTGQVVSASVVMAVVISRITCKSEFGAELDSVGHAAMRLAFRKNLCLNPQVEDSIYIRLCLAHDLKLATTEHRHPDQADKTLRVRLLEAILGIFFFAFFESFSQIRPWRYVLSKNRL